MEDLRIRWIAAVRYGQSGNDGTPQPSVFLLLCADLFSGNSTDRNHEMCKSFGSCKATVISLYSYIMTITINEYKNIQAY